MKYLGLVIFCFFAVSCSHPQDGSIPNVIRVDVESPAIQEILFHSKDGDERFDQSISMEQSVTEWSKMTPYFLIRVDDPDTPGTDLNVSYTFYREDRVPSFKRWKRAEPSGKYWKVALTQDAIGHDILSFIGSRIFILEIKITDRSVKEVSQKIKINLMNQHPELKVTVDPSDIPNPPGYEFIKDILAQSESHETWNKLKNHEALSKVVIFKKIWIENNTRDSFYIEVFNEGSLYSKTHTREYGRATVDIEIYELNKDHVLSLAKPIPFEGFHSMYKLSGREITKGLLVCLLSDFKYAGESKIIGQMTGTYGPSLHDPSLQMIDIYYKGNLKILSAPINMDPSFYGQELNWNDLSPKYLPRLALISH